MLRLRLIDVKPICARVLNLCTDDPRVTDYVNRSSERLLYEMKSVGTWIKYRVCVKSGCLTWPRQIETIETAAVCERPITLRNQWFEFLENGFGLITPNSFRRGMIDQGEACAFDDVVGTGKKLAVYCDVTEAADTAIILQYYDKDGQWVRTKPDTEWIDGESITLPAAGVYAYSSLEVMPGGLVRVIKPKTNGTVRLYQYTVADATLKPLAYYEPSETVPVYRRSLIPSLSTTACCGSGDGCDSKAVTIIGKLRFIPAEADNDFLPISHLEAIRLAVQGTAKEEKDLLNEAIPYWSMAIGLLKRQLEHHNGVGVIQPIRMIGAETFGAAIPQLI